MRCLQVLSSAVRERKNKHHPTEMVFSHDRPVIIILDSRIIITVRK